MTHEYTLLLEATVLPGGDRPACEAIAWAGDTIIALGSDAEVRAISRGDSHVLRFPGAVVVPAGEAPLVVGGRADMLVLSGPPDGGDGGGRRGSAAPIAVIVGGRR